MRRGAIGLVLGLLLLCPRGVQAQGIPVYDNANFIQNVVTAVQTVIMVGNQVLERVFRPNPKP
jgi:conjugal transfer/entry exclusion protein